MVAVICSIRGKDVASVRVVAWVAGLGQLVLIPAAVGLTVYTMWLLVGLADRVWGFLGLVAAIVVFPLTYAAGPFLAGLFMGDWSPLVVWLASFAAWSGARLLGKLQEAAGGV